MKPKEHTRQVRDKVVEKFKAWLGYEKISQALNISQSTVQSITWKWKEFDTTANLPRHGRPPNLTGWARKALIREAAKRPMITVSHALHISGCYGGVATREPSLKHSHAVCAAIWGTQQTCGARCSGHTAHHPEHTIPTLKHGGGSITLWGCFSSTGAGKLVWVDGKMNGANYRTILEENLLESAKDLRLGRSFTFQQDNKPTHTARATMEWFRSKTIHVLEWPSQSLNLNPIENLWQDLKTAVHRHSPSNQTKLKLFCKEEWANISVSTCASLVETYPKRLAAVIEAKGGFTKYWLREVNTFACHTFLFYIWKNV